MNNFQLELGCNITYSSDQLLKILKCHTNLKELRLSSFKMALEPLKPQSDILYVFNWICENLNELEVLEVPLRSGQTTFLMLKELKKLRYFSTNDMHYLPEKGFLFKNDSLETLKIGGNLVWLQFDDLKGMVRAMAQTFTSLTKLNMNQNLSDLAELSDVLSECTKLTALTSFIEVPNPQELVERSFPNIRHLTISTYTECDAKGGYSYDISQGVSVIISIVRAMPNLKIMRMPCTTILYNINETKEFIRASKNLEELIVASFKLDHDLFFFNRRFR